MNFCARGSLLLNPTAVVQQTSSANPPHCLHSSGSDFASGRSLPTVLVLLSVCPILSLDEFMLPYNRLLTMELQCLMSSVLFGMQLD